MSEKLSYTKTQDRSQWCRACGAYENLHPVRIREMMFGTRQYFDYVLCGGCKSISICSIPDDIEAFYPKEYNPFDNIIENRSIIGKVKLRIRKWQMEYELNEWSLKGYLASIVRRGRTPFYTSESSSLREWMSEVSFSKSASIIDVGCGSGLLLRELRLAGYKNLTGIDPFLPAVGMLDEDCSSGHIHKMNVREAGKRWPAKFDLVMAHHVIEHIPDPAEALSHLSKLVKPTGTIIVRVPVADTYAWKHYREDWVQLDAPRHVLIPSVNGFKKLATKANLSVKKTVFDSSAFMFLGSELYRHDVPLCDIDAYRQSEAGKWTSQIWVEEARRRAATLNMREEGDQAAFYLVRN